MKQYSIHNYEEARNEFASVYGEEAAREFFNIVSSAKAEPIASRQAWILTDEKGNKYLQSYNTIVSVKFAGEPTKDLGKWSPTTSRHQSIFGRVA